MLHHSNNPVDFCDLCEEKLKAAHPDLQTWFRHIKKVFPTAHISWSFRDHLEQEKAFRDGKSEAHFPFSPHNKIPAMALDLFELKGDGSADWQHYYFEKIADYCVANDMPIAWGGNFVHIGDSDHYSLVLSH